MSSRSPRQLVLGLVLIAALMAVAAGLQQWREAAFPVRASTDEALYVTSGKTARRLAVGYSAVASDLYWIRTIQYYGGLKLKLANAPAPDVLAAARSDYQLLYPMLDLTTSLDPRFNIAYRFGAIFLAEAFPGGAGRPDQAIALLEKGLSGRPDKWEYMQDIGFVYYWWMHDYKSAVDWFDRASKVTGAPWWLKSLAATTAVEGGDRQSSRVMWEAIRESAEIDWLRHDAERRLLQLQALDGIDQLQKLVDGYTEKAGRTPTSWAPLGEAGDLPRGGVPRDPAGAPFEIDPMGHVRLSPKSPLYPLPDEPKRLIAPPS